MQFFIVTPLSCSWRLSSINFKVFYFYFASVNSKVTLKSKFISGNFISISKMSHVDQRNNDEGETGQSIENAILISFSDNDQTYDLEIRNISNQEECLQISIVSNACVDFFHGVVVENRNFPQSFATVFGSPLGLFEYIVQECENALEIQFEGETNQKAILKITVEVLRKNRCLKLIIPKQPLTEEMLDKANLQKLNEEILKKTSLISAMEPSIGEAQNELARLSAQKAQKKQQEKVLMQQWAAQLQQQSILKAQNLQIQKKIQGKKQEIKLIVPKLISLGISFSESEIDMFHQVINGSKPFIISSSNKKRRIQNTQQAIIQDPGIKVKQKESRIISKNENNPIRVLPQKTISNKQESKKIEKQSLAEKIQQMKVNQNITPQFSVQKLKSSQENPNKTQNEVAKTAKRVLQINSDISSHQSQLLAIKPPQKLSYRPKQQKIEYIPQKPLQITRKPSDILRKPVNIVKQKQIIQKQQPKPQVQSKATVVILSSPSEQDEQQDNFNKLIGTKIEIDLSACDHLNKYKIQRMKSRVYVQRINPDKLFYNLYHSQPIKGRQNMQLAICQANKNDITVGIMYKDALKTPRIQGPKEVVSWVGCYKHIVNQLDTVRVEHRISASDSITVVGDTFKNTVSFYINKKLISTQLVKQKYMKNAYFFFQTATLGNKLYYL